MENKKEISKGYTLFKVCSYAILWVVFSAVIGFLFLFIIDRVLGKSIDANLTLNYMYISTILGAFVTSLYVIRHLKKNDLINVRERFSLKTINYKYLLGIFMFGIPFVILLDYLLIGILKLKPENPLEITLTTTGIIMMIAIVISAPLFEEIVFRFSMIEKMETKFNTKIAIIVSALLFTMVHIYGLGGTIAVFMIGIVLALIYTHTRNLVYAMFFHFINNALAVTLTLIENSNPNSIFVTFPSNITHMIILIMVMLVGLYILYKEKDKVKYLKQ